MTGCPASVGRLLGTCLLLLPIAAWAQGSGPVRLIPGLTDQPATTDQPAGPPGTEIRPLDPPRPADLPRSETPRPAGQPEGVQIERLGAIDPAGLGLIREGDGGLPRTLWRGSDRGQVERLIAEIKPTRSQAALTLTRRLLLSEADPPPGQGGAPGLFALRLTRLAAIGDPDSAFQLARIAPGDGANMQTVEMGLLADRAEESCKLLPAIADASRDGAWRRTNAFCRAVAKDLAGAGIQAGLLRERGEADPVFLALMTELSGLGDGKPIDIKAPTPLQLAMMKAANKPPTPAMIDALSPGAARLVADIGKSAPDVRLRSAERAFVYGALPVEDMRTAYGRDQLPPKDVAAALAAKPTDDIRLRMALFQGVQRAEGTDERARALNAALDRLRSRLGGLDARFALVHLDYLLEIQPAAERVALGPNAVRLLLATGQDLPATAWDELLRWEGRGGNVEAARAAVQLYPLIAIAAGAQLAREDLTDWIDAWRAAGKVEFFDPRAVTVLSALQGLGQAVPGEAWSRLAGSTAAGIGRRPNFATMQAMRAAAQAGRVGETIALALLALDGESPAELEAEALATTLDSLVRVGLTREARALALEAAIGLGL